MNRYKPVGWRNESHRHYLAAKGIKTKYDANKYFYRTPMPEDPDKSHVGMLNCPWCGEATGVLLDRRLRNTLSRNNPDTAPCKNCEQNAVLLFDKDSKEFLGYAKKEALLNKESMEEFAGQPVKALAKLGPDGEVTIYNPSEEEAGYQAKKYYALKDFLGEEAEDKEAFLSNHKLGAEGHMLRHGDISAARNKAVAEMNKAMEAGDMTGAERERFIKEDFKGTAQEYLNGHITKDQFDQEWRQELEWHKKVNRKHLSPFDWGEKKEEPKQYQAHKYYAYSPTYVAGDLPLIAGDALGTVGAEAVAWAPVAVPVAMIYGGAVLAKKSYEKTKKK